VRKASGGTAPPDGPGTPAARGRAVASASPSGAPHGSEEKSVRPSAVAAALVAAGLLMMAWIASAPPASNPDGRFHLVSIWCAEGTNDVDCLAIPGDDDRVLVPRALANVDCFAYQSLRTAACTREFVGNDATVLAPVQKANLDRERPDLYYRTMRLLKGEDFLASVTRMRVANATAGILLFALTSLLATPSVRRGLHGAWLLTSVPLGVWLLSTTNTGAWMIAGVGTAWANLLTATDRGASAGRRSAAVALAALGALMGMGARTEAAAMVAAMLIAVLILRAPSARQAMSRLGTRRTVAWAAIVAGGLVVAMVALVLLLPQTAQVSDPLAGLSSGLDRLRERGAGNPLLHLVLTVPSLLAGALGVGWGLGWIDVLVPVHVGVTVLGLWSAMLAAGLARATRRQVGAVAFLAAVTVAFPTFTLAINGLFVGEEFQPRHYVILLYMVVGFALVDESRDPWRATRARRIALVTALGLAHAHLLHQNTRRYVTGLRSEIYFDLGRDAEWWWTTYPLGPTANWLVGSIAFAVVAWHLSSALGRTGAVRLGAQHDARTPQRS
jgi:hypothetical protein